MDRSGGYFPFRIIQLGTNCAFLLFFRKKEGNLFSVKHLNRKGAF